jgi:L,D-transpeptidase ErfK/SrfK
MLKRVAIGTALVVLSLPALSQVSWGAGHQAARGVILGHLKTHIVRAGETLEDIARRFDLGFTEIRAANPDVDPWLPEPGTALTLPTSHITPAAPHVGIVINLADQRLYLFGRGGTAIRSFPIGIGRQGWNTPTGDSKVVRKRINPTWRVPASIRKQSPWLPKSIPPGPRNPLGRFALNLSIPGYLIHGTNVPDGIGRRVSHGCIRLYPEDIRALFAMVPVGTPVRIVNQPVKTAWRHGAMLIEVHPTLDEVADIEKGARPRLSPAGVGDILEQVRQAAGERARQLDLSRTLEVIKARRAIPEKVMYAVSAANTSWTSQRFPN